MYLSQQHLFRYKKISACNSESFHKTILARTLHGSAATQSRWCDRFYSRYVCWSFLIARVKKLLKLVNRNQKYCKDKSSFVHGVDPFSRINQHFTRWCSICRDVFSVKLVHLWYCWCSDATASSCPERRRTSDHRRSTARPHVASSPAAALASSPPTSSVQAGGASVQSAAWASPTVLDGRLSTRCRCRSPSTTVIRRRHMYSATDLYVPRRSCVRSCRTTSVERFADQPPSAWPLPLTPVLQGCRSGF